jgi:hypothetical protein
MMLVLPLQLSWAAAATYCQHESSPAVSHYGHHVHKHLTKSGDAKSESSPSKLLSDDDCTVCHLGGAGIVSMPSLSVPVDVAKADTPRGIIPLLTSSRPDRPERPKWKRAVS